MLNLTITNTNIFVLLISSIFDICHGVTFIIEPYNTSAVVGQTGVLACIATDLGSDQIAWKKKQQSGNVYNSLTFGTTVLVSSSNKYAVSGTANLTISNVDSSDTGLYQCVIGSVTREISFTAVVPPTNVSVYWESSPINGNRVNITCRATYGNPPPLLKWFKGTNNLDLTNNAYYYTENIRNNGYGDSVSTMIMQLQSSDQNSQIRCEAAYNGLERVMEYTLNIQLNGGQSVTSHLMMTILILVASTVLW